MAFSEKLFETRTEKGLSQTDLANKTGLSQTAIYLLEKGKRNAKFETLLKIADALDTDFLDLADDSDPHLLSIKRSRDTRDIQTYGQIKERNFSESIETFREIQNDMESRIRSLYYSMSDPDMSTWVQMLEQYYPLLNDDGKARANSEMKRAIEQIELLTQMPEYQRVPGGLDAE